MIKYSIPAIALLLLISCNQDNTNTQSPPPAISTESDTNKVNSFFPVTSFLKGQLLILDSLPVTPLAITVANGKTDSAWIPTPRLKPMLEPFFTPVIGETNLLEYFRETRFNDQTLNAITFTYEPIKKLPDSITLRRWDVYVDPEKGYVTKVYIVKQTQDDQGQAITQQLTWQTNKQSKNVTIINNA